jgi:hypothetical protein
MYVFVTNALKLHFRDTFRALPHSIWNIIHLDQVRELVKQRTQNRRRMIPALACLLAVVSLYAPFAAAACSSQAMACCTDGFCNIPNHHHTKAPANSTSAKDCGHDVGGMMNCSMSCCQDPDKSVVVISLAFVLPPVTVADSATIVTRAVEHVHSIEIPRSIEPVSPPPRTDNAAR